MNIKIYGKPNCQWCEAAKNLLDMKKIPYTYTDLIDMPSEHRIKIIEDSGMRTVPIIKVDGHYIGGFDQLDNMLRGEKNR
jgi:glutaredoxin 3